MKRIKKYQGGSYFRLPSLSSEFQTGASYVANVPPYINTQLQQYITNTGNFSAPIPTSSKVKDNTLKDTVSNIGSSIIGKASDAVSDKIFGDSELGRNLGTIFSSGLNSVGDTVLNNAIKKAALTDGLTKNLGSSVGGAVAGLGANYLGRGITSILGNNAASRFLGQSASTVGGTIGGKILSSGTKNLFSGPGSINPIGLGMSAVGAGLSAATGPSKEYNGTYGSTTKALDTVYDALQAGIGLAPGGQIISGALALNKGLSNLFGSTDGMTSTDAILGSAFMPAPIKWLNMLGSSKTGTFNKQSWQNTQKTSNFMQNAFGDLEDKFSKAREEAGKTYGTFSQGAKRRAQDNIDFSNFAWNKILNMADQNEYQNIRSSDMASINNQKYAQWIQGGFSPLARGKNGMKIFNNSINHNLGQRLLSGAALIDNKQMILSAQNGTKIKKKGIKSGINVDYYDPNNVMSVVANNPNKTIVLDEMTVRPYNKLPIQSELFQGITNQAANEKADEYVNRVTPTAEDLLNIGTLGGLNNLSPTQWTRRAYDLREAIKGNMSWDKFGNSWFYGNNGLVSNKYAQEHPYASAAINLAGDIGAFGTFSALRKLPKYAMLMKAENRAAQEATALNWRDMFSNSVKRTRVGDVEIDNPNLLYHLDRGNNTGAFSNHGAYVKNGILFPGVTKKAEQLDYSWWNKGKPYATSVGGQPMTRLMTATKDTPGMLHVRSQNYPIGQWNGNKGFVLSSEYVSPEGVNVSGSTYTLEPTYGWKRVFKDNPTIKWEDATRTPRITAENTASEMSNIVRTVGDNGKIRLSLPSHTNDRPRQFVLEPQGNNKFYVHMRTWDGDHIPANLTNEEKQQLFDALYNELPEGAEILFPKSGPGYYGTRGTVAGLQRLARDPRFTPGTRGTLQYLDKDGKTVRTYEGTSFIKIPQITAENATSVTPIQDVTENIFSPDYLANTYINSYKDKSKYIEDIANDMYGLNPNLQLVDYNAMNEYGKVFNERIKKTLPLAKKRGTLRTEIQPNIVVADGEGRNILYDRFINDTPILRDRKEVIHWGDPVTSKGKLAKKYYYMTRPAEGPFDARPSSFADRENNTIVVIPRTGYKNMYKYTVPHEKTHIFIDGRKEAQLFGTDRGFGVRPHKAGDTDIQLDLYLARPDEQLARGTQIKNYLGITDESPITPKQLKYAAENYVKDTGYDNNMTEFFSTIKDYKKAAKWLSRAPVALPFIGGSTAATLYNKSK